MCCHAVSQQMRTFTSLRLLANQTYLYLRQQLWPLERFSIPRSESSGSISAGRLCQVQHSRRPFVSQFTRQENTKKRKGTERGEKLSGGESAKSYYTQKVISVYLSSLLSLLVQAYRNSPICFFFIPEPSEPRLAPLCCVQRRVHLFSTTGTEFVFICFYKLQGAEAFRGATVFLSPPVGTPALCLPRHVHLQRVMNDDG